MQRLFLNYAHRDKPKAALLAAALREEGCDVWFDRLLLSGRRWTDQLLEALVACDGLVHTLSLASSESGWCAWILAQAAAQHKPIVFVLLERDAVQTDLPAVDFSAGLNARAAVKLSMALRTMRAVDPARLPPAPAVPDGLPPQAILDAPEKIPADLPAALDTPAIIPAYSTLHHGARLIGTLEGHTEWIYSLAFSPDGSLLAGGETKGLVRLWDMTDQRLIGTLDCNCTLAKSLAFSPDGRYLFVGGADRTLLIWDVARQQIAKPLADHQSGRHIFNVTFSPDGKLTAACGIGGEVRLWETASWTELPPLEVQEDRLLHALAFSPDSRVLAVGGTGILRFWDVVGRRNWLSTPWQGEVIQIAFAPISDQQHNRDLHEMLYATVIRTGVFQLRDLHSRQQIGQISEAGVGGLGFTQDGRLLVLGKRGGVILYDPAERCIVHQLPIEGDDADLSQIVAVAPDGKQFVTASMSPYLNKKGQSILRLWSGLVV
jgi:WD40 repeat protein